MSLENAKGKVLEVKNGEFKCGDDEDELSECRLNVKFNTFLKGPKVDVLYDEAGVKIFYKCFFFLFFHYRTAFVMSATDTALSDAVKLSVFTKLEEVKLKESNLKTTVQDGCVYPDLLA